MYADSVIPESTDLDEWLSQLADHIVLGRYPFEPCEKLMRYVYPVLEDDMQSPKQLAKDLREACEEGILDWDTLWELS
jgi:hypothetical protein